MSQEECCCNCLQFEHKHTHTHFDDLERSSWKIWTAENHSFFRTTTSISSPPLLLVLIFILFERISLGQLCQMFLTLWECCLAFGFFKHSVDIWWYLQVTTEPPCSMLVWRGEYQGSECCVLCTWLDLGLLTLHRPTFTLKHTVLHSLDGGDSCQEPACSRHLLLCTYGNVAGCRRNEICFVVEVKPLSRQLGSCNPANAMVMRASESAEQKEDWKKAVAKTKILPRLQRQAWQDLNWDK